jgi:hypothetical protein
MWILFLLQNLLVVLEKLTLTTNMTRRCTTIFGTILPIRCDSVSQNL